MTDFLNLMTQQMENQDPLDPMSDSDFFAQMAQLGQVEGMDQLNASSSVQQAQSLMGQTVIANATGTDAAGNQTSGLVSGVVQSMSVQNGAYYLGVQQPNGNVISVALSAIQSVQQTPNINSLSDLVGKTVTGSTTVNGQASTVTGTVQSVQIVSGVQSVVIQPAGKASPVTLGVSQLTDVSD
jgi:flagellar basal-body rod modification protein FlgD